MQSTTQLLRDILLEGKARTQSEIQREFEARDVAISQPKISRLLHQIGAVKLVDSKGKTQYRLPHEVGLIHELSSTQDKAMVSQWVLDITANEMLIIIHTTPGAAAMVARILDQQRTHLHLLGTIAGDDTIFIAPSNAREIAVTRDRITQLFEL